MEARCLPETGETTGNRTGDNNDPEKITMTYIDIAAVGLAAGLMLTTAAFAEMEGKFVQNDVANPAYRSNEIFMAYEDLRSPRCAEFRTRYKLDEVIAGSQDDWQAILAIRHWVKSNIQIENKHPTRTRGDAFAIMEAARAGGKFHCGHFCVVLNAALNSCGYVSRRVYCSPGRKTDEAHATNEVWVNKLAKWVMVDAKYDQHFEKDGVPLSALEIHDEVIKNGGRSVTRVVPEGTDLDGPEYAEPFGPDPNCYTFVAWDMNTNRFTSFPAAPCSTYWVWADDFWKANTWYYQGKKHWAYGAGLFVALPNRDWFEWTPNVIRSRVKTAGNLADVRLSSFTPNFKTYQMKIGDGKWADFDETVTLKLEKDKLNSFAFRTVNLAGVTGPPHRVEIEWQAK